MPIIETRDGIALYTKDWGDGPPVVLVHGWPLNADSWEAQALGLAEAGHRVVAYDRRGFGRSAQPWNGYDYDTLADDLGDVMGALGLENVTLVGFSMAGGELARYVSRHGTGKLARVAFVSSIAPYMLKTKDHPEGVEGEVFDSIREGLREDRPAFLKSFFESFYGQGTDGGGVSEAVLDWTLSMALMASPRATLECVNAFGRTDLREDLRGFDLPTLVIHGTEDATVPIDVTGRAAAAAIAGAELREYEGAPHGLPATHAKRLTADLVAFARG